jgi:hypothetical protein
MQDEQDVKTQNTCLLVLIAFILPILLIPVHMPLKKILQKLGNFILTTNKNIICPERTEHQQDRTRNGKGSTAM